MANNPKSKLKTLYVMRILQEETDPEHGITLPQILEKLEAYGVKAERKGIYRDLELLREFGVDIQTYNRRPMEYAIAKRDFTMPQLMLLVDAVESCKFLTERQAKALITNLKLLASDPQREKLDRRIHVSGRIASKTESAFGNIDTLHEAIRRRKKVSFMYFRVGPDGKRQATHGGKPHVVTPAGISFANGFYYLSAWSDAHERITEFRIDRIGRLMILDEPATRNDAITHCTFDEDEYESFGMFNGDPVIATLAVDPDKIEIVLDRFGNKAQIVNEGGSTKAIVKIKKSEQFFGWVAGLGNTVRIAEPKSLKQEYVDYLKRLIEES